MVESVENVPVDLAGGVGRRLDLLEQGVPRCRRLTTGCVKQ